MYQFPDINRFPRLMNARNSYYQYIAIVFFGSLAMWSNMAVRHGFFSESSLSVLMMVLIFFAAPVTNFKHWHRKKLNYARKYHEEALSNIQHVLDSEIQSPSELRMRQRYLLELPKFTAELSEYRTKIESYVVANDKFRVLIIVLAVLALLVGVVKDDGQLPFILGQKVSEMYLVAAVICRGDRFLLCQRPFGKQHGGLWEFPGGKVHEEEMPNSALKRELKEELGVESEPVCSAIQTLANVTDDSALSIRFIETEIQGEPVMLEHQNMGWFSVKELLELDLAPADAEFALGYFATD